MNIDERLFTIGHGSRPLSEFLSLLLENGVRMVLDVRSQPHSSRFPQYSRDELDEALRAKGIAYRWMGRHLGGRPLGDTGPAPFEEPASLAAGLDAVRGLSRGGVCALMCAEIEASKCHRLGIADALVDAGVEVAHIGPDGHIEPHQPRLGI